MRCQAILLILLFLLVPPAVARTGDDDIRITYRAWGCLVPVAITTWRIHRTRRDEWRSRRRPVTSPAVERLRLALLAPVVTPEEWVSGLALDESVLGSYRQVVIAELVTEHGLNTIEAGAIADRVVPAWTAAAIAYRVAGHSGIPYPCEGLTRMSLSTSGNRLSIEIGGDPPIEAWSSREGALFLPWTVRAGGHEWETWSLDVVTAVGSVLEQVAGPFGGFDVEAAMAPATPLPGGWRKDLTACLPPVPEEPAAAE